MNEFSNLTTLIKERLQQFDFTASSESQGKVLAIADNVVQISGLRDAMLGETVLFNNGARGLIMNLERDSVSAILLEHSRDLMEGDEVRINRQVLTVPVGEALLGRVVDALGRPVDDKGELKTPLSLPIERPAPGVMDRAPVDEPMMTGIKMIDVMAPIGKGQRELVIGDRQTGKTSIAVDAILNQKNSGIKCIYVAIGQKSSTLARLVELLREHKALDYTIIVSATASSSAAEQYLAPYAACSMGEYFRDKGEDVLIIFDDLLKHAWAYRQLSLLLKRPSGREAYPGDIFYLHSRLLERAAKVSKEYVSRQTNGEVTDRSGSITAIPILETQGSDVSSFVPTNVISITDGQIFLDTELFNSGFRPAMNIGLSVSRVGGAAQSGLIKKLGGQLRLLLAQYRELENFAQFASDLDETTRHQLALGRAVTKLMNQKRFQPLAIPLQAVTLVLASHPCLLKLPLNALYDFEKSLHAYLVDSYPKLCSAIEADASYQQEYVEELKMAINEHYERYLEGARL